MGQSRAVGTPAEHLVAYQHQPGSNGGVHRGPDRQLRTNVVRSILLEALAKAGVRPEITIAGRRRRHRSKVPHASEFERACAA
jgi:hypothetical protein